jgi:anaerobic magnesium-protoporphyrin IX monomethyl ester cyclase
MKKVLLFNPRALRWKPRIPNSVLQVAASIEGQYDWVVVDGNLEKDPERKIFDYLKTNEFSYFASTVMPGPQIRQAIPITKKIRQQYPALKIIWGGYFASNQHKPVINSGYVDAIVYGPGDKAFPMLLNAFENNRPLDSIPNLI